MAIENLINALLTLSLGGAGLYFFALGGSVFLLHPSRLFYTRKNRSETEKGTLSPFGALCVALGGTIGVGNTVGVASALCLGGAGALFWMWVSATLGMSLKYAEVFLSHKHRCSRGGGAMQLLKLLNKPFLSKLFCLACLAVSFGMGNLAQTASAASALHHSFRLPPLACGAAIAFLCVWIFRGGARRLERFSVFVVPGASALFLLICLLTLWRNAAHLPHALSAVFRDAFSFQSAAGGFFGSLFCRSVTAGFSRGIFSNEAGLGSAPLVHSLAQSSPNEQAVWGAREVVLDTHVVCTLTALCILSSPVYLSGRFSADTLCSAVFSEALGESAANAFSVSLFFFAAASIVAWGYYGLQALRFLSERRTAQALYLLLFFICSIFGATLAIPLVFTLSDVANLAMALPNLYALLRFRHECRFPLPKTPKCLQFVHKSFSSYGKIDADEGE